MKRIDEISRKELVAKTKVQSPARYNKRMEYNIRQIKSVDFDELLNTGRLVVETLVGDYDVTIAFDDFLGCLSYIVSRQSKHNCTLQSVTRAIMMAVESDEVLTDCTCGDFKYRFAYWATKYGYKYGEPQNEPANVRNPEDNIGAVCKHLTMVLSNKRWMAKVAQIVNADIRKNVNDYREAMGLDEDEFYVNEIILFGDLDKKGQDKEEPELREPEKRNGLPKFLSNEPDEDEE